MARQSKSYDEVKKAFDVLFGHEKITLRFVGDKYLVEDNREGVSPENKCRMYAGATLCTMAEGVLLHRSINSNEDLIEDDSAETENLSAVG